MSCIRQRIATCIFGQIIDTRSQLYDDLLFICIAVRCVCQGAEIKGHDSANRGSCRTNGQCRTSDQIVANICHFSGQERQRSIQRRQNVRDDNGRNAFRDRGSDFEYNFLADRQIGA